MFLLEANRISFPHAVCACVIHAVYACLHAACVCIHACVLTCAGVHVRNCACVYCFCVRAFEKRDIDGAGAAKMLLLVLTLHPCKTQHAHMLQLLRVSALLLRLGTALRGDGMTYLCQRSAGG